jgi:integrase
MGRITAKGERSFYFRYTTSTGQRDTLPIGSYDPKGRYGYFTLAGARDLAGGWAMLYKEGARDLRQHFSNQAAEKLLLIETAHQEAELEKLAAKAAEEKVELEKQRRLTVKQVFERWAATELKPHVGGDGKRIGRKDGGQYVREQFERRVYPNFGDVAIVDVHKADVLTILDAVKAEGKLRTANVLLADLKQMFRFAAEREIIEHSPIELINKRKIGGKDIKRDRVLSADELMALATQLPAANLNRRTVLGIWLILATGCRIGELMGASWSDSKLNQKPLQSVVDEHNKSQKSGAVQLGFVDLVARTWYLPTTKNQRDHLIHLSDFAYKQFSELANMREADRITGRPLPWVFPDSFGTGPVCIKSFGKQLADRQRSADERLMNRTKSVESLKLSGGRWTAHDLRRTTSTMMSQLGISNDVINECENHIKQGMSGVYIQDRRQAEQVLAFDALGQKLTQLTRQVIILVKPEALTPVDATGISESMASLWREGVSKKRAASTAPSIATKVKVETVHTEVAEAEVTHPSHESMASLFRDAIAGNALKPNKPSDQ